MIAALSILTGPVGKVLGIAVIALVIFGLGAKMVHEHDNRVLAEQQAAEQAKTKAAGTVTSATVSMAD